MIYVIQRSTKQKVQGRLSSDAEEAMEHVMVPPAENSDIIPIYTK